jgi:hypothetical protein
MLRHTLLSDGWKSWTLLNREAHYFARIPGPLSWPDRLPSRVLLAKGYGMNSIASRAAKSPRALGVRRLLSDKLIEDLTTVWQEKGAAALSYVAKAEPSRCSSPSAFSRAMFS